MASTNTNTQNSLERARGLIDNSTDKLKGNDLLDAAEFFSNEALHHQWLRFHPQAIRNTLVKTIGNAAKSRAKVEGVAYDEWRHDYDVRRNSNAAMQPQNIHKKDRIPRLSPHPSFAELASSVSQGRERNLEFHVKLYKAYDRYESKDEALQAIYDAFGHTNLQSTRQLVYLARQSAVKEDGTLHAYTDTPPAPSRQPVSTGDGNSSTIRDSSGVEERNASGFDPNSISSQPAPPSPILTSSPSATIPPAAPTTKPATITTTSSSSKRPRRASSGNAPPRRAKRPRHPPLLAPAQATLLIQTLRERPANFHLFNLYTAQLPPEHYGESEEDAASVLGLCEESRVEEALIEARGVEAVGAYFAGRVEEWVRMGARAGTWYSFVYECIVNADGEMERARGERD